ncbi:DUF6923 family protein [Roseibacillus persicicus]|uniref:DUF6923 family protein n=1 Tax=Roseibacillus persicicus TaxID=454148 RepID=UPI00280EE566|nr:laminin B domain-containing protein [Roseibacillus persicicus]MDQ8188684.1 DUF4114 domain-containing protein [Roseibacillus persicicus]
MFTHILQNKSKSSATAYLVALGLSCTAAHGSDSDNDGILDTIENQDSQVSANDLVLNNLTDALVTANGGILSPIQQLGASNNIPAQSFEDDTAGYGYFRIAKWTGDQSASLNQKLHYGIQVRDLGTEIGAYWATTSTADVRLVSNTGERIEANIKHGAMEVQPLSTQYGEIYQYSVPLTAETFQTSNSRLTAVLSDLAYIEIRAEYWGWARGVESFLVPAGQFWNGAPDTDGDGTLDYLDTDSDNDGTSDLVEGTVDSDGDGLADYRDRDSDNDGILDSIEGSADLDGDGLRNAIDLDSDGDNLADSLEGNVDTDGDLTANFLDSDSDNDGVLDSAEGAQDLDGDTLANYLDTDADDDGIPDGSDPDADGDGISNFEEAFAVGNSVNLISNGDFDELDADLGSQYSQTLGLLDDGIAQPEGAFDVVESAKDATVNFPDFGDANGGGDYMVVWTGPTSGELVWSQEVEVTPGTDYVFSAAVASTLAGLEPALDFRVDGSSLGVPIVGGDVAEWNRTYAGFNSGEATTLTLAIYSVKTTLQQTGFGLDAIALSPITTDTDGDGAANYMDADSDGDTLADSYEGQSDPDGDGLPNFLDLDSDNDTIGDEEDGDADPDGDGIPGYADTDSDNDLIEDFREGFGDFDEDGIPDHLDNDADNDGNIDAPGEDSDNDGIWNEEETLSADTDDDGTPDYLDTDSDNDGLSDALEGLNDIDADGTPDYRDYQPAFSPSGYAFESYNAETQLAIVDVNAGVFVDLGNTDHGLNYNAIAYRTADNYIYGLNRSSNDPELLRFGSDGSAAVVGLISGLPRSYVAGTFADDGLYWVSGGGRLYGIDVDALTVVKDVALSPNPKGTEIDLAHNFVDGKLYGSTGSGVFFHVDRDTGSTTVLGNNGKTFGALICDFNGAVYGFDNRGTGAFRVNLSNGSVTWVANAPKTNINDGTINPTQILVVDTDGDGISDEFDIDDDNDGVLDPDEGSGYDPSGDEDGDGIRNWTDNVDNGNDGDGSLTDYTDTNGAGIPDVFDVDQDGTPNHLDDDADGDGLSDTTEAAGDADTDGLPNFLDSDSDNDGIEDGTDGLGDTDGDGIPDYLDNFDDRDQDNDGIPNGLEGTGDTDGDGLLDYFDTDSDDDGYSDSEEAGADPTNPRDSDGDGIRNFQDFDDDNDDVPTANDPCPLCNLADNYIEFDIRNVDILADYDVYPGYYDYARDVWNEVKFLLNCNTEGIPLEQEKRGFDEERFYLAEDCEVFVTVIFDGADYHNSLAFYDAEDPAGTWTEIWKNFVTGPTAPLIPGSSVSLGVMPAGTQLRFGLVMDGGNGGTRKIYQDSFLNPGGQEFCASKIELTSIESDPIILAFEDQLFAGRDNDFNDVIIMVECIPSALGTAQFAGVVSENEDAVASAAVTSLLTAEGMNDASFESTAELLYVPEGLNSLTFDLVGDQSDLEGSFALYDYDKLSSVSPNTLSYREVAAELAEVIFDDRQDEVGASVTINPVALGLDGKHLALVYLPGNTFDKFNSNPHRYTPRGEGDDLKRQPLFSVINANPGSADQFLFFTNETSTLVCIEDLSRADAEGEAGAASSNSFAGAQIRITPALSLVSFHYGQYMHGTPDVTADWTGTDGYSDEQNGDY